MAVGKRIYLQRPMPKDGLVEAFAEIPSSNTCDVMERITAMHPRIHLVSSPKKSQTAGVALTVKLRAGDNLALHAAMEMAGPGDYLVVSNEGDDSRALMGSVMMSYIYRVKEIAGIILDGPIRDIEEISQYDFPVYATGTTPGGPYKEGPGEVNVPIACGNVNVCPGDIILADHDGVTVIPRQDAEEVLEKAKKVKENDIRKLQKTNEKTIDRSWVGKLVEEKGFEYLDKTYFQ